jgi:hypothetical protein
MDFLPGATQPGAVVTSHGSATDNGDFHHAKLSSFPLPSRFQFDYENDDEDEEDFETKKSALKIQSALERG